LLQTNYGLKSLIYLLHKDKTKYLTNQIAFEILENELPQAVRNLGVIIISTGISTISLVVCVSSEIKNILNTKSKSCFLPLKVCEPVVGKK